MGLGERDLQVGSVGRGLYVGLGGRVISGAGEGLIRGACGLITGTGGRGL